MFVLWILLLHMLSSEKRYCDIDDNYIYNVTFFFPINRHSVLLLLFSFSRQTIKHHKSQSGVKRNRKCPIISNTVEPNPFLSTFNVRKN